MPGLRRQRHNVKPTAITIGCVVEALVINKQGEEAWQLVQDGVNRRWLCPKMDTSS